MSVQRVRRDWITRRRYLVYILLVSLGGGGIAGYLLGGEHTLPALAALGITAALIAVPRLVAERPIFDERDYRIDDRAARYTMYVVMVAAIGFLVGPIALEQLGVREVQGGGLLIGLVLIAQVYLYVAISLVLRYQA